MGNRGRGQGFSVQVLGVFSVRRGELAVTLTPTCQRLVALLAVEGAMTRSDAAFRMWPDSRQGVALGNLRTVLCRYRSDITGLIIDTPGLLHLSTVVVVDLHELRHWAGTVLGGDDGLLPMPPHVTRELLPTWGDPWLIERRDEVRQLQLHALEAAAQRSMMAGRFGEACSRAQAALSLDPLRESAIRLVVEIHLREGNAVEAVRRYWRFQRQLQEETGCRPGPALTTLLAPVLAGIRDQTVEVNPSNRRRPTGRLGH
jgi:DNA-binding SARP family transcriptional activator